MESGLKPASVNGAMVGLRFFFRVTLRRPEALEYIPMAREPQRLPVVLTQEEVARLLEAAPGLKWRTALSVAYGAGLRASEVVASRSATSTASACASGSSRARDVATATRYSRAICWPCCATGGRWRARRCGCSPTG